MSWAMVSLLPDRRSVPPTRGRFNTRACSFIPLARGLLPVLVHERPRRRDEAPPTMSGPRSHGLRGFPPPSGGEPAKSKRRTDARPPACPREKASGLVAFVEMKTAKGETSGSAEEAGGAASAPPARVITRPVASAGPPSQRG